jgi:hypothetical protein
VLKKYDLILICSTNLEPVYDNGIWRIRTNKELMALYQELDKVGEIKKARLRWVGHVERLPEVRVIKKQ